MPLDIVALWYGMVSILGSAPIKAAEEGRIKSLMGEITTPSQLNLLPESIPFSETVFGNMNLIMMVVLITCLPFIYVFLLGRKTNKKSRLPDCIVPQEKNTKTYYGAEKMDRSKIFSSLFGLFYNYIYHLFYFHYLPSKGLGIYQPKLYKPITALVFAFLSIKCLFIFTSYRSSNWWCFWNFNSIPSLFWNNGYYEWIRTH